MKKTIELAQVRQGEVFEVAGERFVRLSEEQCGAILVLREDVLPDDCAFERAVTVRRARNRYDGSTLEYRMVEWLPAELQDASVFRPIDLTTMDGMTDYGMPQLLVRALTVMEYQRYRRYIPLTTDAWWTATGCSAINSPYISSKHALNVTPDGTLDVNNVSYSGVGARPALYLKSSIAVSIEREDGEKELKYYTDRELLAELARRDDARHTAPERG